MRRFLPFAILSAVILAVWIAGGLDPLERQVLSAKFRLLERPGGGDVVVVAVDPHSLRKLDVWPWPRGYHATVLENLLDAGARTVGFDIDFSSRSDRDEDAELAAALAAAGDRVVLPFFRQWEAAGGRSRLTTTVPLEAFRAHAALGAINIQPDDDGLVRRYAAGARLADRSVPTFAVALAGAPQTAGKTFHIDFAVDADSIPRISYVDVLAGTFDPADVAGRVVIVGSTAVELGDQVAVPVARAMPGPLLQALACESLLDGRTLRPVPRWLTGLVLVLLASGSGPWLSSRTWRTGAVVCTAACAGAFLLSLTLQRGSTHLVEVAPWWAAVVGSYTVGLVRRIDQQKVQLFLERLRLRRTRNLMNLVVENSFDAIVTVREDGVVEGVNPSATTLFGRPAEDLTGRPVEALISLPDDTACRPRPFGGAPASGPFEVVAVRHGKEISVEMTVTTVEDGDAIRRVAFLRDITERKAQRRALEHQANHDALTDLPNRLFLGRSMQRAIAEARERKSTAAFLLLDLDHFREINDTLGHHTGDLLLKQIAARLRSPLRGHDTIARLGGDEFAVLLPRTAEEDAVDMARRLAACLTEPFPIQGLPLQVATSIGIAMYPEHGRNPETLIQRADVAMYSAKRDRSGVAVYRQELDHHSKRHLVLTGELRGAIENDGLRLCYQPKIAADTGRVVGVEALVRWQHPEHGTIFPDEFITIAEQSGLIGPLTSWVLETALRQCATWREHGIDLEMAVNLSARNLLDGELPANIRRMLSTSGVPSDRLSLEITESVIMEDPRKALEVLTGIAGSGVGISIDDFGTGYSSLGYLRRLPAGEIKIDKSFVMDMDRNPDDAIIVRSTIDLAHNLGLRVVAEGVEREEIWSTLRRLGCDLGQGYLFSKPLEAEALERWHRAASPGMAATG